MKIEHLASLPPIPSPTSSTEQRKPFAVVFPSSYPEGIANSILARKLNLETTPPEILAKATSLRRGFETLAQEPELLRNIPFIPHDLDSLTGEKRGELDTYVKQLGFDGVEDLAINYDAVEMTLVTGLNPLFGMSREIKDIVVGSFLMEGTTPTVGSLLIILRYQMMKREIQEQLVPAVDAAKRMIAHYTPRFTPHKPTLIEVAPATMQAGGYQPSGEDNALLRFTSPVVRGFLHESFYYGLSEFDGLKEGIPSDILETAVHEELHQGHHEAAGGEFFSGAKTLKGVVIEATATAGTLYILRQFANEQSDTDLTKEVESERSLTLRFQREFRRLQRLDRLITQAANDDGRRTALTTRREDLVHDLQQRYVRGIFSKLLSILDRSNPEAADRMREQRDLTIASYEGHASMTSMLDDFHIDTLTQAVYKYTYGLFDMVASLGKLAGWEAIFADEYPLILLVDLDKAEQYEEGSPEFEACLADPRNLPWKEFPDGSPERDVIMRLQNTPISTGYFSSRNIQTQ